MVMAMVWLKILLIFLMWNSTVCAPIRSCDELDSSFPPAKKAKVDNGPRCKLFLSELKLGSITVQNVLPFIEVKSECTKRPGPQPKNPLSIFTLIILLDNPVKVSMIFEFNSLESFDYSRSYYTIGSPNVKNVDASVGTHLVQSAFSRYEENLMLPEPGGNSFAIVLLENISKGEIKKIRLLKNHAGVFEPKLVPEDVIKSFQDKVVDMVILTTENDDGKQFDGFWKKNVIRGNIQHGLYTSESTSSVDLSLSMCGDFVGFNPSYFLVKPQSPGEENICNENLNDVVKKPLLHSISHEQLEESKQPFDPNWLTTCENVFPKVNSPLISREVQKWLSFGPEPECVFTCKACLTYFEVGFRPDYKHKSNIAKQGYLSKNIYDNRAAIYKHEKNEVHLEALEFYYRLSLAEAGDLPTLIYDFEAKEQITFNATMNVVLFVYAELKAGVSFRSHETFMNALRLMGSNVGWFHHTSFAAQIITKIISRSIHQDLLHSLVSNNQPFSILVDSTTSKNHPYLAVYFQTTTNGKPTTHFYALIHMAKGERSKDMVDSLIQQIKLDSESIEGFEDFFKAKVSSISSDGASVMVGSKTSFRVFLIEYIGRRIPNIVCLAHNLDRAYKVGIKHDKKLTNGLKADSAKLAQLSSFKNFDKIIKKLYKFYAGRGHKNWLHFLESANYLDKIPKTLKYPYDIRWSETLFESIFAVYHNWYSMVFDLDEIVTEKEFDAAVKAKAVEFHQRLTDKSFLIILHEFLDILTTFKTASKRFQRSSTIVVGKVAFVYEVLDSLNELKVKPGKFLSEFLGKVTCTGKCKEGFCTLDEFDACEEAMVNNIKLEHQYPVELDYSEVRIATYDSLISSVGHYFKIEMLESFEVFNPARLAFPGATECPMLQQMPVTDTSSSSKNDESAAPNEKHSGMISPSTTPTTSRSTTSKTKNSQSYSGSSKSLKSGSRPSKIEKNFRDDENHYTEEQDVARLDKGLVRKHVEKLDKEMKDVEKLDKEIKDVEKLDKEKKDVEKLDKEKKDVEKIDKELHDVENLDEEVHDVEKLDKEMKDVEKLDKEIKDVEKLDKEIKDVEKLDKEIKDVEKLDKEKRDVEKLDKELHDVENLDKELHDVENLDKEKHDVEKPEKGVRDKESFDSEGSSSSTSLHKKFRPGSPAIKVVPHLSTSIKYQTSSFVSRKPRSSLFKFDKEEQDEEDDEEEEGEDEEEDEDEEEEQDGSKQGQVELEKEELQSRPQPSERCISSKRSGCSSTNSNESGSSSSRSRKSGSSSSTSSKSGSSSSTSSKSGSSSSISSKSSSSSSDSNPSDTHESSSETSDESNSSSSNTDESDSSSSESDESDASSSSSQERDAVLSNNIAASGRPSIFGPIGIDFILAKRYNPVDAHVKYHVNENYGFRMDYLCRFYYFNDTMWCGDLLSEWIGVLDCILSTDELRQLSHLDAPQFWPHALLYCDSLWTPATKKMLQLVLVTSYSSSECERGFSIMNNIKTKSRSSLEKDTIDAIMKAKINGPELEDFFTYKLTIEVLKTLARVDDNEFGKKKN